MICQWYLFVLLAAVGVLANSLRQVYTVDSYGQQEIHYGWIPVIAIIAPMIYLAATRPVMGFGDTGAYKNMFEEFASSISAIPGYLTASSKDKGFGVVSIIIKSIVGQNVTLYFAIIATFCLIIVGYVYKEFSCSFIISIFLFIASGEYIQWTYNGIRQFIAVAIIFAGTKFILTRQYMPMIILILLASTIHMSALVMLPVIFIVQGKPWNKKTFVFSLFVIIALVYLEKFTNLITTVMENSQYSNEVDQFLSTEGTNILRVFVFAIPPILSLVFYRYIELADNKVINMCVNMSIITLGVYVVSAFTSGIFIGRIPIFFSLYNYILIPWIVENVFEKRSRIIVYFAIIIAYLIFYYYQVDVTWGL